MKARRLFCVLLALFLSLSLLAGCGRKKEEPVGRVVYQFGENSDIVSQAIFSLNDKDGTFSFNFNPLSSFMGFGSYRIKEGVLTLTCDKKACGYAYTYVFRADGDNWIFDAAASSDELWMGKFGDGDVFRPVPEEEAR